MDWKCLDSMESGEVFAFVAQPSWRYLQLYRLYIENTCKFQVEASIWKDIFWMWRFFSPSPESLLPWQQQKIHSKGELSEWACEPSLPRHGCAEQTSAVANCVTSTAAVAAPSHCSPYPLLLPALLCLNLISGFYLAGLLFSWYPPIPASDRLTFLSSLSRHFFKTPSLTPSHPPLCICFILLLIAIFYADALSHTSVFGL